MNSPGRMEGLLGQDVSYLRTLDGMSFSFELGKCSGCLSALAFRAGDMGRCFRGSRAQERSMKGNTTTVYLGSFSC